MPMFMTFEVTKGRQKIEVDMFDPYCETRDTLVLYFGHLSVGMYVPRLLLIALRNAKLVSYCTSPMSLLYDADARVQITDIRFSSLGGIA